MSAGLSAVAKGRGKKAVGLAFVLLASAPLLSAATLVHDFYLPLPEAQIRQTFTALESNVGTNLDSVFSVVITGEGTVIYYDQWEDGYETDLAHPVQATTQVWGDGNNFNGIPPGYINDPVSFPAGTVLTLRNFVPLPRNPANLLFDGRDRMAATKALVVSHAAWATTPGPVLSGAVEVTATIDYGTSYVCPVGQDLTNKLFQYVGLFVMAAADNTVVTIDTDGPGATVPFTVVLNRGESYLVNGGIKKSASVNATKPVQVNLVIGHIAGRYATDWFTLYPTNQWDDTYITPVCTANNGNATYVYLYNPGPTNLTINYTTRVGSGSFTVAGNGVTQYLMPQYSGARFSSAGGQKFFALSTAGANPSSDTAYDWGFTLLPESGLTTEAVVGWGPGSSDGTVNGSPVWVTPAAATRVYVDYNGDRAGPQTDPLGNKYDVAYDLAALESKRIYDPDKNQTAMRLYTLDGTLISAAWGEDPDVAGPGNPYLDFGTTVLPFPVPVLKKSSSFYTDINPPGLSIGDVIEYTIQLDNHGLLPLGNTVVVDTAPTNITYLTNSTTIDGAPVPDSVTGTPFPLDGGGYTIPIILRAGMTVIKYQTTVVGAGSISNTASALGYNLSAQNIVAAPPVGGSTQCGLNFSDAIGTTVPAYTAGGTVYVTLTDADANTATNSVQSLTVVVQNTARADLETITLTETGNNTGIFRNPGGLPTSLSSGLAQQDGILHVAPGDVLSVTRTDPVFGDTCNASAIVATPVPTKVLYLSDPSQALDRVDPVATSDNTTAQTIDLGLGVSTVTAGNVSSTGRTATATVTLAHTTAAGANRLLMVSVAYVKDQTARTVSSVTYGNQNLTLKSTQSDGGNELAVDVWYLVAPNVGTTNVVVTLSSSSAGVTVGATSFNGVDPATPLGTAVTAQAADGGTTGNPTVTVASAAGELVYDAVARDNTGNLVVNVGQTQLFNLIATGEIRGTASTKPGAASVTMIWTNASTAEGWCIAAIPIKPAAGGTNTVTFTQTPAYCQSFSMPSNSTITITNYINVTGGSMPANPAITARLKYGATTFATFASPTYNSGASNLVWSGVLATNVIVPGGQALNLVISNTQSGVTFNIAYDSLAKPSKILLPTTTVVHINGLGVYDAPYPGGSLVTTPFSGQTVYVRTIVSDPFGSYDISSLGLTLDGPGAGGDINTTLTDTSVVANDGCSKIYEYVWQTGATVGTYNLATTANEGTEGITDSAATSVLLTFLDTGTPGATEFTSGNNGPATNAFAGNSSVCVRVTDLDQNTNSSVIESLTVIVASSTGDSETITLTETGTNTGVFTACVTASTSGGAGANNGTLNAPVGSVLTLTYTDPNDASDQATATATVLPAAGTPGVTMSKTLISPADGQAGIGETVQFGLQVINTGSTTLTNVSVTDTFPSNRLSFVLASLAPTTASGGTLTWANVGPLTPGQSTNILVAFTATGAASPAVNSATANAGGTTTNTSTVGVTITHAALTITKTLLSPTNGTVNIGSNATFRIVVQNTGDTPVPSVPLEDTFSASCFEFVSATVTPDGAGAGSLLWNDITGAGTLATNASLTLDVTLKVVGGCDPANNTARSDYAVDVNGDPVPPAISTVGVTTGAGRIAGSVYNDVDQSGTLTGGDLGLDNVTLELFSDPNGDGDPSDGSLVRLVNTDVSGAYELLNLSTGAYVVVETDLPGYASSAPANNRLSVVLTALTTNVNNNFFDYVFVPTNYATIRGTVWADTNASGTVNVGEVGIANVTVELVQDVNTNGFTDIGETVAASTTTDANGAYAFAGVIPGHYVIRETDLYGWLSTADSRPPNDNQIGLFVGSGAITNGNDFLDFFTGNNPGNDAPVANNDAYSTSEDSPLNISAPGVLGNDTDVDGDPLSALLVNPPTHGALTLNANGSFSYTPATNYFGADFFTYRANDGTTNSGLATVNLTITAVNDAPIAVNDSFTTAEDTALNVPVSGVLTNDVDVDGDALTALLVANVTHGTLSLNASGAFSYTPATNYFGADFFTYRANDGTTNSGLATVNLTITSVNDPPVAMNDVTNTVEDVPVTIRPLVNDGDLDGDPLTIIASVTTNGLVVIVGGTNLVFTPATNFNGSAVLTYTIIDGNGGTNSAIVTVTVTPVNDPPVAVNDSYSLFKNATLNLPVSGVLTNDSDVDGDVLTAGLGVGPTHGVLTLNLNGSFTYTPVSNYVGADSFTYRANDGTTNSGLATVNLTIAATNTAPVAANDGFTTLEDTTLTIPAAGILTNDTDVDGDSLTAVLGSGPTHGALTLNANGSFSYTPATNYNGSDSFTYRANDGVTNSGVATVTINITPVNDAPLAVNDTTNTLEDVSVTVHVLANDSDPEGTPLTITGTSTTNGTAVISGTNVVFTPATNFNGTVVFNYTVSDGTNSATANVTVTVNAVDDAPVTVNDAYSTPKNVALNLSAPGVLVNDTDVENDPLSTLLVANVTHGTLTLNANGSFLYTPASNYVGSDVFTYRAYDSGATGTVATVTLTILATNTAPVANTDSYTTLEDTVLTIPVAGVLTNDVDADGDALTALLVANVTHGALTLNANGSFSYTPATNYNGSDSFTYRATDGSATSGVATVTLTITPVNDVPLAVNDTTNTLEDVSVTVHVLANDSDPEGTPLTLTGTSTTNGTAVISGTNVVFTPATNFNGTLVFTYTVSDGTNSATATVSVTVSAVDDAPVTVNDAYSTLKNAALNLSAPGVLGNDTDVENDPLSTLLVATVTHGTLTLNANGSFLYTPASNYVGSDVFTYRAYDSGATGTVATVTLTTLATNSAPTANGQSVSTVQDTAKSITLTGSDPNGDALTFATVTLPANGTLSGLNTNTGAIIYTPNPGFIGTDSFTFRVHDGSTNSTPATVNISVGAQADLAVFKSGPTNFTVGSNLTFTITTTNLGPSTATNVVVSDQLPAGYTFVSGVPLGATVSNHLVSWPALTLSALGRTNFSVTVLAIAVGNFTNITFSTAGTPDPNPSNNDGTATNSQVTTVVTAGASPLFGILQGTNVFNPQAGLFEQRVTVTNISAFTNAAVQLLVDNIRGTNGVPRTNVFLYNATGTNVDLRPYVQYNSSLNPGSNVTLILEFYVPDRKPFTNSLEALAVLPVGGGTNNGTILLIRTNFFDLRIVGEPRYVIEFDSIPNRTYTVQYSNDGMATWSNAVPSITANANRTQWYDDGPPKTDSKPMSVPSRFYRVLLAP